MKTKFYWVALLASAALIGQAQGGGEQGGGVVAVSAVVVAGLDPLEAEAVSVAVASTQRPRRSVVCADPLEWEHAEAELASAYRATLQLERVRHIGGLSIIMDELADSVTPSLGARTAVSQPQNRFSSIRNPVGQRPAASNRPAIASAARSPGTGVHRGLNGRTDHIAERHDANWHRDWDRRHAHFFHNRFFVFDNGFWCGLDAGFFPWDYLPYYAGDYYPYDYYTDVQPDDNTAPASAYPYSYYTGVQPDYNNAAANGAPAADPTVEATQEQLAQLGYYNGPVDGIFGPTTRDAVAKYQIDNQLDVTGSLSPDTLQSLGLPPGPNN